MSKNKKIIFSVAMVMLLVATAYLNVVLTRASGDDQTPAPVGNFFSEFRSERSSTRDQEILYLDSIIGNQGLTEETIENAVDQKLALVSLMESELVLEGLIKAKGFQDVAVTMSSASENVNVVVKTDELSQEDVAQIYSILAEEVNAEYGNIKIIPIS